MTDDRPYMSVQLQLLHACNLKCAHCYDEQAFKVRQPSTSEMLRRIDAIYEFADRRGFAADIHLSGGEPTLRRDLLQIVRHIFDEHDGDALLFSNGTKWTREGARKLRSAGLRYVQVSLEGPKHQTNEIRGDGVFQKAMTTLKMLREEDFRRTISVTVTSRNFPGLFDFVESLDSEDVHFHLREVFPIGSGSQLLGLTHAQRRQLAEWVIGWSGKSSLGLEDPVHCSASRDYARSMRGCVAGRNHFCVDVDGSVFPCRPLEYPVGTVDDLEAAWTSPTMQSIREQDFEGQCGRCQIKSNCGGCRVHALLDGNILGEDRRCFAPEEGLVYSPFEAQALRAAERVGEHVWKTRQAVNRAVSSARSLPVIQRGIEMLLGNEGPPNARR